MVSSHSYQSSTPDDLPNHSAQDPVLILGAGVNGSALARELVQNGVPVRLVDLNDIAFGATSKSSRLIHGGLRYLEYGDFSLVRESLLERSRLRQLAPQFVEPLTLFIPVRHRWAGLVRSVFRFLGGSRTPWLRKLWAPFQKGTDRGLWLVRCGLWLYDRFAQDADFPAHRSMRVGTNSAPKVDASAYRWLCSYTDAQMRYPERFVLALIEDARQLAEEQGAEFRVFPYHRARRDGQSIAIERIADEQIIHQWNPPIVVNATGAWGDATLEQLEVDANRLFGGTKGSHFVTHAKRLREAIGNAGVYAEAEDGRLVFVLPFGDAVLVGTTDEFFDESPERAAATESELEYLLELTNALFEGLDLTLADVDMHYSGVRPLPCAAGGKTASVSRDHFIDERRKGPLTVLTLIGGKLTTARAFAELAAERVLGLLGQDYTTNSRTRAVPGGRDYPASATAVLAEHQRVAEKFQLSPAQIAAMWSLWGNRVEQILDECQPLSTASLSGTEIPLAIVRWIIQREWVTSLEDLIERRLMLVYHAGLTRDCLCELAGCLVEANLLEPANVDAAIVAATNRLSRRYGKTVTE